MTASDYAHLLPPSWTSIIPAWLAEDTPSFDYGGYVVGEKHETAHLLAKKPGILAGVPFVNEIFKHLDCTIEWHFKEGDTITLTNSPKLKVATVKGKARFLLLGERIALNVLARCSGIATTSRALKDHARQLGWNGTVAGTRKTTPGFRIVEKYGMLVGGVDQHRYDLSAMVMLKDNHIWSKGSITEAVKTARKAAGFALRIDVECTNEEEAVEAVEAGADIIMLDNFAPAQLRVSAKKLKERFGDKRFLIEVSGGLTEDNLADHICEHVDIMSTSSIHQSVQHIDFSLKIIPGAE